MMFSRRSKEAGGSPSDKAVVDGDTTLHCARALREEAKKARRPTCSAALSHAMAAAVFVVVGVGLLFGVYLFTCSSPFVYACRFYTCSSGARWMVVRSSFPQNALKKFWVDQDP